MHALPTCILFVMLGQPHHDQRQQYWDSLGMLQGPRPGGHCRAVGLWGEGSSECLHAIVGQLYHKVKCNNIGSSVVGAQGSYKGEHCWAGSLWREGSRAVGSSLPGQ